MKKINRRPEGVDIAPCPPPNYAADGDDEATSMENCLRTYGKCPGENVLEPIAPAGHKIV